MNITDNPISKPALLEWRNCITSLPGNQDIRHLRLAPRYVIQIIPSIFKGLWHTCTLWVDLRPRSRIIIQSQQWSYNISLMFSVKGQAKF